MRTLIAIPTMGKVDTAFFNSMMYLKRSSEDGVLSTENSLVYDARNRLADSAVKADAKYILWVDSDMVFDADTLERLVKDIQGKDFVTALCFRRRPDYDPCIYQKIGYKKVDGDEVTPIAETYMDYPKNSLFEIEGCGFACALMKVSMYSKIKEQCGTPFAPVPGFGEDISFCIKARECGYKLYCDSSIKVGHISQMVVTEETFEVWRANNVKQS